MLCMVMQLAGSPYIQPRRCRAPCQAAEGIARKAAEAAAAEAEALASQSSWDGDAMALGSQGKHRWRLFHRAPDPVPVPEGTVDEWEP